MAGHRHVINDSATILSRANQAVATLERYKARLDEVTRQLSVVEIEDFVTLRDALTVAQRLEMMHRVSVEIEQDVLELGTDGRQVSLTIFNPEGSQIKANVSQLEPIAEGEPLVPGTWHWPELVTE